MNHLQNYSGPEWDLIDKFIWNSRYDNISSYDFFLSAVKPNYCLMMNAIPVEFHGPQEQWWQILFSETEVIDF